VLAWPLAAAPVQGDGYGGLAAAGKKRVWKNNMEA